MGERMIRAFFAGYQQAEAAATRLKSAMKVTVDLTELHEFPGDGGDNERIPLAGSALMSSNMGANFMFMGPAFMAAHILRRSGLEDRMDAPQGSLYMLETHVDDARVQQARDIIFDCGGRV